MRSRRRTSGSPAPTPARCPRGRPDVNAEITRRIFAGEPGPARDVAVLNAGAAIYVSGTVGSLEEGVRAAEAAIDDGRAAAALDALASLTKELVARMSVLDQIVDDTRDGGETPSQGDLAEEAREAARGPRRGLPAVLGGAHAPRRVADRRAQAALAVGGQDPQGLKGRRGRAGLRARRSHRAVDPHRAVSFRRLARRPARGARARDAARCCARTSSSIPTSSTRRPPRAPTRSC